MSDEHKTKQGAAAIYRQWLERPDLDEATRTALLQMQDRPDLIREHFGAELAFGTGGMRGVIGPGINRINIYLVRRITQGLANLLNRTGTAGTVQSVAIAYDTRSYSRSSPQRQPCPGGKRIKALCFCRCQSTPELTIRSCAALRS